MLSSIRTCSFFLLPKSDFSSRFSSLSLFLRRPSSCSHFLFSLSKFARKNYSTKMANHPTNFKLHYFSMHGRAGPIRLAFHATGIPYENVFVGGEDFKNARFTEKAPIGSIPTLSFEVDGKVQWMTQSNAQLVLVSKLGNLWFDDALNQARAVEILDLVEDAVGLLFAERDEEKKKAHRESLLSEADGKLYHWLKLIDSRVAHGNYIVGGKFSAADAKLFFVLTFIFSGRIDHIDGKFIQEKFTHLAPYIEKVKTTPEVAAFFSDWDKQYPPQQANMRV
jgi:glutathione S-transferase